MQCEFSQNENIAEFAALAAQSDVAVIALPDFLRRSGYQSFEVWDEAWQMFGYPQDAGGAPLGSA